MKDNELKANRLAPNDSPGDPSANGEPYDERSLITAYALGELTQSEAAEIENRLRESADDAQIVSQIERFGNLLRKVAVESPLPQPSEGLPAAVLAELAGPPVQQPLRLRARFPRRRLWVPLSLAASLAVVCGTLVTLTKTKHNEQTIAQREFIIADPYAADEENDAPIFAPILEDTEVPPLALQVTKAEDDEFDSGGQQAQLRQITGDQAGSLQRMRGGGMGGGVQRANHSRGAHQTTDLSLVDGNLVLEGSASLPASKRSSRHIPQHTSGSVAGAYITYGSLHDGNSPRRPHGMARDAGNRDAQADFDGAKLEYDSQKQRYQLLLSKLASSASEPQVVAEAERQLFKAAVRLEEARKTLARDFQGNEQLATAPNTESYSPLVENPFRKPTEYPLSTFSIDVDTASYSNVRRFLNSHAMPPPDAVRIEELINYFQYAYPQPEGDRPFSVTTDVAACPWDAEHRLLRVGLKGREVAAEARPAGNLVFLLDVSGSMEAANKLPLVKEAMGLLTDKLTENDRVAIVTYAGSSGLALPPTNGTNRAAIRAAIDQLTAGGSTNGGQGLETAYQTAQAQLITGGTNRVILATDGDFNVGTVNQDELVKLVAEKAKSGVYLTALGFGMGNLKDGTLEKLADKGNGNYAYIDTLAEARRVLVEQLTGTLVTIAKDVKLQIEFNPAQAASYRLIGYENRLMPPHDFHDDRKDGGEIGAGHTVTALYEIVPAGADAPGEEPLKYQPARPRNRAVKSGELATLHLRYKDPEATESRLLEHVVRGDRPGDAAVSGDFQFAAAVAEFGMLIRNSPYRGAASYKSALRLAERGLGNDPHGHRAEFIELVRKAREVSGKE